MSELSIFNVGEHADRLNQAFQRPSYSNNLFDPRVEKAGESKIVILRPMPYIFDVAHSIVGKNFYVFKDLNGNYVYYDSRTTFNDPANNHWEFCPVGQAWNLFNKSTDPAVKARQKLIPRRTQNYCYVQILKYPSDEKLIGRIMPMAIPMEMKKFFDAMACPSEDDIKLGTQPVNPFDLFNACPIKLTITGKIVNNTLMRDWKVEKYLDFGKEAIFPLGAGNAWLPISQLDKTAVENHFKEQQTENLVEVYGYHQPSVEVEDAVRTWLRGVCYGVPGIQEQVDSWFPHLPQPAAHAVAQPAAQAVTQPAQAPAQPQAPANPAPEAPAQPAAPAAPQAPAMPQTPQAPAQPEAPAPAAPAAPIAPQAPAAPVMPQAPVAPAAPAQPAAPAAPQAPAQPGQIGIENLPV